MIDQRASRVLGVRDLGLTDYKTVWELQKQLQQDRIKGKIPDTLILCEHRAVITLGRSANTKNILANTEQLSEQKIDRFEIERGGDVTFHNPGQLVLYPILNLNQHRRDVDWYMRSLETVVINVLTTLGIESERIDGKTGVWIKHSNSSLDVKRRKIASIGVRISRWVTMHGLALNVSNDLSGFTLMNPCGFSDIEITSIYRELEQKRKLSSTVERFPTIIEVKNNLLEEFSRTFNFQERINHAEKIINCSRNSASSGII